MTRTAGDVCPLGMPQTAGTGLPVVSSSRTNTQGPFGYSGVVLDDYGSGQPIDDVAHKDLVGCEFLVPMNRNTHLSACHQGSNLFQRLTQCFDPSVFLIDLVGVYGSVPLTRGFSRGSKPMLAGLSHDAAQIRAVSHSTDC